MLQSSASQHGPVITAVGRVRDKLSSSYFDSPRSFPHNIMICRKKKSQRELRRKRVVWFAECTTLVADTCKPWHHFRTYISVAGIRSAQKIDLRTKSGGTSSPLVSVTRKAWAQKSFKSKSFWMIWFSSCKQKQAHCVRLQHPSSSESRQAEMGTAATGHQRPGWSLYWQEKKKAVYVSGERQFVFLIFLASL